MTSLGLGAGFFAGGASSEERESSKESPLKRSLAGTEVSLASSEAEPRLKPSLLSEGEVESAVGLKSPAAADPP